MQSYKNAAKVLPKELVREIRKHCTGMIYVPNDNEKENRRKLALILWKQNTPVKEIAMLSGLSDRRVYQVIAQERLKNAFPACAEKQRRTRNDNHT